MTVDPQAVRNVVRGGILSALGSGSGAVLLVVTTILLVRGMEPKEYGAFALALSMATFLSLLCGLGISRATVQVAGAVQPNGITAVREVLAASDRIASVATRGLLLTSVVAVIFIEALFSGSRSFSLLVVMLPTAIVMPLVGAWSAALRVMQRPAHLAIANLAPSVLWFLFCAWFFASGVLSDIAVSIARTATIAIGAAALWLLARRVKGRVRVRPKSDYFKRIRTFAISMWFTAVFSVAVSQLDVIVLGLTRGTRDVAAYQPVSRLNDLVLTIPFAISSFLMPNLAELASCGEHRKVAALYHWASRWNLAILAPALSVMLVCPGPTLHLAFGSGFRGDSATLRILGLGAAVQTLFGYNGLTLDSYGVGRVISRQLAYALFLCVAFCFVLIPMFGATGAAAATSLSLVASNSLYSFQLWRRFAITPWDGSIAFVVAALVIGLALGFGLDRLISGDVSQLILAVVPPLAIATWASWRLERARRV